MKNYIHPFVFIIFCSFIAGTANGQGVVKGGAVASDVTLWPQATAVLQSSSRPSTLGADLSISYFEPNAPTLSWIAPANWSPLIMTGFTERITLPTDSGFVDSVQIVFDSTGGDSIAVLLDPDTVILTPVGYDHLDEGIFNLSASPYATAFIHPAALNGSHNATVVFPHVAVPKNFHVGLVPHLTSTTVFSFFYLRGDTETTRVRTVDNCHSTFIAFNPSLNQYESGVVDGNLTPAGYTSPLYSNFYISAFVSTSASSVSAENNSPSISLYPNPATTFIQFQGLGNGTNVELLDVLGHIVLSEQVVGNNKLDISGLRPGRYEALVHTANGLLTVPVVIQR